MPDNEDLAVNVKRLRKSYNESQEVFAHNCGISTRTIGCIENANTNPKTDTIQKIAAYTGTTVSQLFDPDFKDL